MGCGASSADRPLFEKMILLKLPMSLDSADENHAYDYILSTWMSPTVMMQLAHLNHVTNAFDVQGGVIAHKFEGGNPHKPQSDFYETKQRTSRTMHMSLHTARGTISDPTTLMQQTFCVTPFDISLKRTSHDVEAKISVGQPALTLPGGGMLLRMIRQVLLRKLEQVFTARQELYASDKVPLPCSVIVVDGPSDKKPLPCSVDVAQAIVVDGPSDIAPLPGQAIVVDCPQQPEAHNVIGATFGSMNYGGLKYGM